MRINFGLKYHDLATMRWSQYTCFYTVLFFNSELCLSKYLDGKPWLIAKSAVFKSVHAEGYAPNNSSGAALSVAKSQFQESSHKCIIFDSQTKPTCKPGGSTCGKVACSNNFDAPYFCVEKGKFNAPNMSAGISPGKDGSFPTYTASSAYTEFSYIFAANLIARALGLRSQMEVRPDFEKYIKRNDEALIQSMASLTESYGVFTLLPRTWAVKDLEALVQSIYARHCSKNVFSFDHPFDFRSVANAFSAFGDIGYVLAIDEPAAAYVANDRANQWMLGYSQLTGPCQMISHYDVYKIMSDYRCSELSFDCEGERLICRNFGYVDNECKCRCAPGFIGTHCEIWSGAPYPRALKAMCSATVSEPQILSLEDNEFYIESKARSAEEDGDGTTRYDLNSFGIGNGIGFYSQWCTIVIQAFGDQRPVIEPVANLFKPQSAYAIVLSGSSFVDDFQDCSGLMTAQVLYSNATKRRVLCFSSIYLEDSPQIRPNRSDSSIDINWVWTISPEMMTPNVFKIILGITYEPMPSKLLRVFNSEREAFDFINNEAAGMRSIGGGVPAGAIAGSVVAVVLIGCVVGVLYYIQRKKLDNEEAGLAEFKED